VVQAYRDVATLTTKVYRMNDLKINSILSAVEYQDLYPLFVLDVSKQEEKLKSSSIDIEIKAHLMTL
jgi:hypothetical protein